MTRRARREQGEPSGHHLCDLTPKPLGNITIPTGQVFRARFSPEAGEVSVPGDLRQAHLGLSIAREPDNHESWTTGDEPVS